MNKIRVKRYSLIVFFVMFFCMTTNIYADDIVPNTQANKITYKDKISAPNGEYYFIIPVSWENYISAYRQKSSNYVDRITFYYNAKNDKQTPFVTVTVYNAKDKNYYKNADIFLQTEKLVFVKEVYTKNPYTDTYNNIIYSRFITEVQNAFFMKSCILLPSSEKIKNRNTITFDGKEFTTKSYVDVSGVTYIPLRQVCEQLNYKVTWYSKNDTIKINSPTYNEVIYLRKSEGVPYYKPIVYNSTTYLPYSYYVQKLNLDVQIDSYGNVTMSSK